MPSSRPNAIPTVIHLVLQLKPMSILDVGIGFGKWGHLFREYTDIIAAENDAPRYEKPNWKTRIDGVEGFPQYLTDLHHFLYDEIHVGNMVDVVPSLGRYDLIFIGDAIEHVTKEDGIALLKAAMEHANKAVIVSTPKYYRKQDDMCGNTLEIHRSHWTPEDFQALGDAQVVTVDQTILIAALRKPGVPPLKMQPQISGKPRSREKIRAAVIAVIGERAWNRLRGHRT